MLITLGIIGVVAALTIPTTITKFQQKTFSTAFKKEYSTLNNAINMLVSEQDTRECHLTIKTDNNTGSLYYSEETTDCVQLKKELISKLNLTPIKKDFAYANREEVKNNGGESANFGVSYDYWLTLMSSYMMKDGSIIMFCYNANPSKCGFANVAFVIDINGHKAPNRWGYDAFWLTLVKTNSGLRLSDEYATLSEKGGSLPRNILLNSWGNNSFGKNLETWQ